MRIKHAFAGLVIAALAGPAAAMADQQSKPQSRATANATKYCLEYEPATGSRLRQKQCLTKEEWAKRGVNVDEVMDK